MKRIYMDNAATSFPKPPEVIEAMVEYQTTCGASPGRGGYTESIEAGRLLDRCRERMNTLINGENPDHVIFTLNTSDALNLAIRGMVMPFRRRGEPAHVVTTWMDHNSILRPLHALEADGVTSTYVECDPETGRVDPDAIRAAIRPDTRLVATNHGSNVTGTLQPVEKIGVICRELAVPPCIDRAQSLGHMPVDVQAAHIDLLAFPGHKGLLGPSGTGGLYIRPGLERQLEPIRHGGTGSASDLPVHPENMPDRYEPGSHNAIGIIGLSEGLKWLLDRGVETLWREEQVLTARMMDGLMALPCIKLLGPKEPAERCSVFSIVHDDLDAHELAAILDQQFGILTRAGVHCAPLAHRTLGTMERGGAVRLSLGPFMGEEDVDYCLNALAEICKVENPTVTA